MQPDAITKEKEKLSRNTILNIHTPLLLRLILSGQPSHVQGNLGSIIFVSELTIHLIQIYIEVHKSL